MIAPVMTDLTMGQALARHYAANGLPPDGGRTGTAWTIRAGGREITLRNFAWRREALQLHAIHHLLTGYACTLTGELEMAAWEFAAGRFRHPTATLFCLPLIGLGFAGTPQRSYAAFLRGRSSQSLYAGADLARILASPVTAVQAQVFIREPQVTAIRDAMLYAGWVTLSFAWLMVPAGIALSGALALKLTGLG